MGGPYRFISKHFSVTGPLQDGIIKVFMAVFVYTLILVVFHCKNFPIFGIKGQIQYTLISLCEVEAVSGDSDFEFPQHHRIYDQSTSTSTC